MPRHQYVLQAVVGLALGSALQTEIVRCDGWTVCGGWTLSAVWGLNIFAGSLYLIGGVAVGRAYEEGKRRRQSEALPAGAGP